MNPPQPPTQPTGETFSAAREASTETGTNPGPVPAPAEGAAGSAESALVLTANGARERKPAAAIRRHDFRQSGFLAPSELRQLRLRHEQFARALAARLAVFFRLEFTVQLAKLQIVGYQKFVEALPGSTHVTLFKTEPLKGTGLLVIPPRLGLSLVDRMLGGAGQLPETGRDLSEIEVALVDQAANLLLAEWCGQWPEMRDWRPALLGHENHSGYLQTAAPDTAMLELTLKAGFAEPLESIQVVIPYATVEPLVRLLTPAAHGDAARAAKLRWNKEFDDVPVPVIAEWQGLKLSAGEVARLKNGDVLMFDAACASQVQLCLSRVPKFIGRPGTRAGKWAVELTAPVPTPTH